MFCGLSNSYALLVAARIITGLFGGVIFSISLAIVTDLFAIEQRGRVMGFIQMGFGASQVLGIPIGLYLANHWGWQAPFLMIVGIAVIMMLLITINLQPITKHLSVQRDRGAFAHLLHTVSQAPYRIGFGATALLSIGGFMLMPFGSAFAINNLHVTQEQLPLMFMIAGISSLIFMPYIGKLSDKMDKFVLFTIASVYTMVMVVAYTNLIAVPFWIVVSLNVLMMAGILSRTVPATALTTAVPEMQDRGAFMSINSSLQQIAGGIASACAGLIVVQPNKYSPLQHYSVLGWVIVVISSLCIYLMYRVDKQVKSKRAAQPVQPVQEAEVAMSLSE